MLTPLRVSDFYAKTVKSRYFKWLVFKYLHSNKRDTCYVGCNLLVACFYKSLPIKALLKIVKFFTSPSVETR